jgi:hypothetical protein
VYFGYVIGGGGHKIKPMNMEAILKWPIPTNVIEVRSFFGKSYYIQNFIESFSVVVVPLHAITSSGERININISMH